MQKTIFSSILEKVRKKNTIFSNPNMQTMKFISIGIFQSYANFFLSLMQTEFFSKNVKEKLN